VQSAAVALTLGHDPFPAPLWELDGDDELLAVLALERAGELLAEQRAAELKWLAEATGSHVAAAVARLLRRG
jgi:hypothetical protein